MDIGGLLVVLLVFAAVNAVILFFVIKAAVKSALSEDRVFQAKVQKARAQDVRS